MERQRVILTSVSLILLLAMVGLARASLLRSPGVAVGDSFTYGNVSFSWYSNDSSAVPPTGGFANINDSESVTTSVGNIVGTNVTCSALVLFKNGSDMKVDGWVDVDTGDNVNMSLWFISANLAANDSVYGGGFYQTWMINETIPVTYQGVQRDTNHLLAVNEVSYIPTHMYSSYDIYWDKATGVMTKMSMVMNTTMLGTETDWSFSFEITESTKWVVPEFAGLAQILLLLSSLAPMIVVSTRKLRQRTQTND